MWNSLTSWNSNGDYSKSNELKIISGDCNWSNLKLTPQTIKKYVLIKNDYLF